MKRLCRVCNQKKLSSEFYNTYSYKRHICKKCENKQRYRWKLKRSREMKLKAVEYLGGQCKNCGYDKCIYALEFNHIKCKKYEPTKLFQKSLSWESVKNELDKCELLCANCHRETTFKNK